MSNPNINWDPNLYTGQPAPAPKSKGTTDAKGTPEVQSSPEPHAPHEHPIASAWPPPKPVLPGGKRERIFALALLLASLFITNATLWGAYLGFTLGFCTMTIIILCYLAGKPLHISPYSVLCLVGSVALAGSFSRSADWTLLFPAFFIVLFGYFMALTSLTQANARSFGGFSSILDVCYVAVCHSFGRIGAALRGLFRAKKDKHKRWKPGSAFWGVVIAIPVLCVLVPLLMEADAAFAGLISQFHFEMPQNGEFWSTVILGLLVFLIAYPRAVSLRNAKLRPAAVPHQGHVSPAAVNAFLGTITLVYCLYLLSQLAYFFSAFQGILPDGFSHADYARRGFFEMSWIVAINLAIIGIVLTLEKRENATPKATKVLCLFFCVFSLLLIATAFSKMLLYMNTYGLTRKRVLTSLFMLWLTVCVVVIGIWLFRPKLPYMKVAVVALLLIVNIACWADVDNVIARYNVTAYQSGKLEAVDLNMLSLLSDSAIPWVAELAGDDDPAVAEEAQGILMEWAICNSVHRQPARTESGEFADHNEFTPLDWRSWNYAASRARAVVIDFLEDSGSLVEISGP